jgi:uncharacterized protein (DUF433 family)
MLDRIEINPRVCGGIPIIQFTRIPVGAILDPLAAGETWNSILSGFSALMRADFQAVLRLAPL